MILICKRKCFLMGRSINPGQSMDIPENLLSADIVRSSFRIPQEKEKEKAEDIARKEMERSKLAPDEIKRRLAEMGVAYRKNASPESLEKLYFEQVELRSHAPENE